MCVKLSPENLNLSPYPPHLTSTYTCGVTTVSRVRSGKIVILSIIAKVKPIILISINLGITHFSQYFVLIFCDYCIIKSSIRGGLKRK